MQMRVEPIHFNTDVESLLVGADLPVSDMRGRTALQLLGICADARLVGVIGVERYESVGLLRSLAVDPQYRYCGYGHVLVEQAESRVSRQGVRALYLLTTTAAGFFARLGYEEIPRTEAPSAIVHTTQFSDLCPSSSNFMRKVLLANLPR